MSLHDISRFTLRATGLAAGVLFCSLALAEVPNTAQDAMLGAEGQGPRDRFTSMWHVDCANAGPSGSGGRRCEVTLQTADRESKNYTMQMRYPLRIVVDGAGRAIELPFTGTNVPAGSKVDLVLDGRIIASAPAGGRIDDPAVFDQLAQGRQLLISTGSFAEGARVRSYIMLDGLQAAMADAQRRASGQ